MSCILCKNNSFTRIVDSLRNDELIKVIQCNKCGHTQLKDLPKNEDIEFLYNTSKISISKNKENDLKDKEKFSLRDTIYNADFVSTFIKKNAQVLDFGCGYGFFIKEMIKRGYKMSGIELSKIRSDVSRKNNPKVKIEKTLNNFDNQKFNCITMFHVLEHVNDPISVLKSFKQYLKPNGLIIVEVPNLEDNMIPYSSEYRDFYWKKEHLSYFDKKSLTFCVKKAGYEIKEIQYYQRWDISNSMNWMINKRPQTKNEVLSSTIDKDFNWLNYYYKQYLSENSIADAMFFVLKYEK